LSTVHAADQVVVLDRGRIVAVGTHEELLAANDDYRRITIRSALGRGDRLMPNGSANAGTLSDGDALCDLEDRH
jgi:hypothetical protein